jgi:CheY-like chemotaxis protein
MSDEVMSHLFEPFFTTKGLGKGTGLGLAVIYGIVKQHGGWINAYSQLGIGTTFKVYFPAYHGEGDAQPSRTQGEAVPAEEVRGKGERILLVEDEAGVRNLATQVLQASGYRVTACASAEEALTAFDREQGQFDLLFSDVVLPDRNGIDLVDLIQARKPGLPALLCSGYTDSRSRWRAIEERNIPFLQKPYPSAALLNAFRRVLGGR